MNQMAIVTDDNLSIIRFFDFSGDLVSLQEIVSGVIIDLEIYNNQLYLINNGTVEILMQMNGVLVATDIIDANYVQSWKDEMTSAWLPK